MSDQSGLVVRPFRASDAEGLCALIEALAHYEALGPPDQAARERLVRDALASPPRFWALVAQSQSELVGYAVFFETYSTFLARPTLYLEDIFVLPQARRQGVGQALFRACVAEALERGCGRMEWQALAWNDLADGFYRRLGAQPIHDEWRLYRLLAPDLARVLGRPESDST